MTELSETVITTAAKWWADQLRRPPKLDNGDPRSASKAMLRQMQKHAPQFTGQQIAAFEAALAEVIRDRQVQILDVDYDVCPELKNAARIAGVQIAGALPWKTVMWLKSDRLTLRNGYHAEEVVLVEGGDRSL